MMHKEESRAEFGLIRIHNNVIASVSSIAACEIEGVKGIGKNLKAGILGLLDRTNHPSIMVGRDKNAELTVQIPLIVKYGFNIPEVAARVQANVRQALDKMTGLNIKDINIDIQKIEKE
ncbi:MAG: Asp23/Gls24 family envelope stress response protein [Candidatus Omnitrophica bacterium]|nr:Asp23/Gls24 family envelope stress response protein [Candidatus Omnitrophota bacterium]